MTGLGLAVSSLRHSRVRTIFMILSVALAIGVLTLTLAVLTTSAGISNLGGKDPEVVVMPLAKFGAFPISYIDRIRKIPDASVAWWAARYRSSDGARFTFNVLGANDEYPDFNRDGWFNTTPEAAEAWRQDRMGALVGIQTLEKMGWHVGDTVTLKLFRGYDPGLRPSSQDRKEAGELTVKVIGVAATGYRTTHTIVHYDYLARQFNSDTVDFIEVRCPREKCSAVADAIDEMFANSSEPTQTTPVSVFFERLLSSISAVPDLLSRVALLIVLLTGFITANTVAMSLTARRSELATLRAIGFTRGRVVGLILVESALVCGMGGIIGAGVPLLLFRHRGIAMGAWALENVTVSAWMSLVGVLCAVLLGILSAVVPALAASRRDIVAAMAND